MNIVLLTLIIVIGLNKEPVKHNHFGVHHAESNERSVISTNPPERNQVTGQYASWVHEEPIESYWTRQEYPQ